jgi:hypothetical protein
MGNWFTDLCARYEWFDDLVELVWWGKARHCVVRCGAFDADCGWAIAESIADGCWYEVSAVCEPELGNYSAFARGEFELVAYRRPSLLRWWSSVTRHRVCV